MKNKKVLVITSGHFPEGDAGAIRLLMVCKALVLSGYSVKVLCRGNCKESAVMDGISYKSLRYYSGSKLISFLEYLLFPLRTKQEVKSFQPDCIYIYNAHISIFKFCKKYAKKNCVKLIHDCVEWYSPEQFSKGEKDYWYKIKNVINTEIVDQEFSVIAISSFLEKFFADRNINVLRIPVLCDSSVRSTAKKLHDDRLHLFYAGSPTKKDYIGNLFKAISMLSDVEKKRIIFNVLGPTVDSLILQSGIEKELIDACQEQVHILGRKTRSEVLKLMEDADFSVLPRNSELRYAKAGFPSKVVESMANATPLLCNYSSDLELYLKDGYNSVIAENHSPEALLVALKKALSLTPTEKQEMSANALSTAVSKFDYRLYVNSLKTFLEEGSDV